MPEQTLPGWNIGWELPDENERPRHFNIVVERRNDALPMVRNDRPRVTVTRQDEGFAVAITYEPEHSDTNRDHFETDIDWHTLDGNVQLVVTCSIKRPTQNTHTQTIILRGSGGGGPDGKGKRPKGMKIRAARSSRRGMTRMLPMPGRKKGG